MVKKAKKKMYLIGYAMRHSLKDGYSLKKFQHDVVAALVVSMVALPLSMALAIAVGLPPQHGIYTAIVAGIIAPLIGGSITQVSGPTAAFVVIVAPIVAEHGLRGLIITEIMAGFILIAMAIGRFGRFISYIPYPVTTGFTSGIAVVLATLSLNDFLGLGIKSMDGSYIHKLSLIFSNLPTLSIQESTIGFVTLASIYLSRYISPRIPPAVLGIVAGVLATIIFRHYGYEASTIGNKFSYVVDSISKFGIPPFPPEIHLPTLAAGSLFSLPTYQEINILMAPAMVIAALAALESLLSATVADSLAGTKHNPNSELFGIGVANIFSGLSAGIPATGAIARTATNIKAGAKTPIASVMHAILIMLYVILFANLISYMPMASLAAILIVTAYHMSHHHQFITIINIAPKSDKIVLLACFGLTVFVDMVAGVTVGILLASVLFMKRMAGLTEASVKSSEKGKLSKKMVAPKDTLIYRISGPLFFGTAEKALDRASFVADKIKTVIVDIEKVPFVDMTALVAMKSLVLNLSAHGKKVIICGNKDVTSAIVKKLGNNSSKVTIFNTASEALVQK